MMGSLVYAGGMTIEQAHDVIGIDGARFGDELARIGYLGSVPCPGATPHAFVELHIEQGPILEAEGKDIGVVTHGQGLWWLEITLTGKDAHTGSTPMHLRVNAGLGMARITERVHQIAMSHQPNAVGAVGQVKVFPNSRNVIPGKVIFTVDIRSPEQAKLDAMRAEVERAAHAVAAELGGGLTPRPMSLRVFLARTETGWQVMPDAPSTALLESVVALKFVIDFEDGGITPVGLAPGEAVEFVQDEALREMVMTEIEAWLGAREASSVVSAV